ncbi:MAG: hypothetical protein WKG07_31380 [Hymenobacter sp.]
MPADYGLRIGVQGGGCSGMSYLLGFDKAKDQDEVYDLDGVQLIMDKSTRCTCSAWRLISRMASTPAASPSTTPKPRAPAAAAHHSQLNI